MGGQHSRKLTHTDIDVVYSKNQYLRWLLFDEFPMCADDLLGALETTFRDAAAASRYTTRRDKSKRVFGCYNILNFGDLYQLPPIPSTAAVFTPPTETKTVSAKTILNMFWSDDANSINSFVELTIQKRIADDWYAGVMNECRMGQLSEDSYNFLHGFPNEHCGSWLQDGTTTCKNPGCQRLAQRWKEMTVQGHAWDDMVRLECGV